MARASGPTVRQRRLAAELRRLRETVGLTGDQVAERLGWSTAKVSRVENARTTARSTDVHRLLELYEVDGTRRAELLALARDAAQRGWWEDFRDLGTGYGEFIAMEAEAGAARQWECLVVPGLLQTEEYARHVIFGWDVLAKLPPQELERQIEVRMRRQQILHRAEPLEYTVVLDESVLRRMVGNAAVMRSQIDHLCEVAEFPTISLRLLPLDGLHPVMGGSFTLLQFKPVHDVIFPDIVHVESLATSYLEDEAETHMYRLAFDALAEQALDRDGTLQRLAAIRDIW